MHLAAESHVDRSIDGPGGLHRDQRRRHLHAARRGAAAYWRGLPADRQAAFRFVHVSTDEVYGSLGHEGRFTEETALRPELALFGEQGGVRPSGARLAPDLRPAGDRHQLLEQLRPLPVSREADSAHDHQGGGRRGAAGLRQRRERPRLAPRRGSRARHPRGADRGPARARATISAAPASGRTSRSSARSARPSTRSCPSRASAGRERLITFVADRPGHDARYAIDDAKARRELGWQPRGASSRASRRPCAGISSHRDWWEAIRARRYGGDRLGLGAMAASRVA